MSSGEGAGTDFATARGRDWPSVRQFNVFLANRVGALVNVFRCFERSDVRILSMTIIDTADVAILRLVLSHPERAIEILEQAKLMYTESDLLVVQLPDGKQPLLQICKALLAAELNLHYAYPLLVGPAGLPALAIHVDNHEVAVQTLESQGFVVFCENDLDDAAGM
ncbi:MAG TPA: acetolactate synthase [Gemmataceae bacterium]|jgi:hypothetical protein|nr:acetolactate synthase [Gemmataceae bacterium]